MARKTYSEEFRRQAVEFYESTPGATFRGIAADLGITRNTLKDWVTTRGRASTACGVPEVGTRGRPAMISILRQSIMITGP